MISDVIDTILSNKKEQSRVLLRFPFFNVEANLLYDKGNNAYVTSYI